MSTLDNVFAQSAIDVAPVGGALHNNPGNYGGGDYTLCCTILNEPGNPTVPLRWWNWDASESHQIGIIHPRGTILDYKTFSYPESGGTVYVGANDNILFMQHMGTVLVTLDGMHPLSTHPDTITATVEKGAFERELSFKIYKTFPTEQVWNIIPHDKRIDRNEIYLPANSHYKNKRILAVNILKPYPEPFKITLFGSPPGHFDTAVPIHIRSGLSDTYENYLRVRCLQSGAITFNVRFRERYPDIENRQYITGLGEDLVFRKRRTSSSVNDELRDTTQLGADFGGGFGYEFIFEFPPLH